MIPTLALLLPLVAAGGEPAGVLFSQTMLNEGKPALSKEQQLLQQMQDRENARGWKTFDGVTYYAWNEWKLISPGVRATSYKLAERTETGIPLIHSIAMSNRISVNCSNLAWREGEIFTARHTIWFDWVNAGSPKSRYEKDQMVAALCANVRGN